MKHKIDYLITGGLGFIGVNFINLLYEKYPNSDVIVIDKQTNESNDPKLITNINFDSIRVEHLDIVDSITSRIFRDYDIKNIVHFAAESHVDRSISSPRPFVQSNILGTFELLEAIRLFQPEARFHHVSTDEVYGSTELDPFTENSTYNPSSVYSASKAASDMLVMSYIKTYGLKASISNCCNNYGEYQNEEKLIPRYIKHLKNKEPLPLFNNGLNIREWIHVNDHNEAVFKILESSFYEKFNIGSGDELQNIDLLKMIHSVALSYGKDVECNFEYTIDRSITDRKGHDMRYAIDSSYLKKKLEFVIQRPSVISSILDLIGYYWD